MAASASVPKEIWMEIAHASCEAEQRTFAINLNFVNVNFQRHELWQTNQRPQHPVYALSQTSSYFTSLFAEMLWSHPAIAWEGNSMEKSPALIQLCRMLDRPIVRKTIKALTIDLRQLDIFYVDPEGDLAEKWEEDADLLGHSFPFPTLQDFVKVENELADKISGLSLKHFEWRGFWRPTEQLYRALGSIKTLESVALDWSSLFMPGTNPPYEPDALHHLAHLQAAALGMGQCFKDGGRPENFYTKSSHSSRPQCPGLMNFLNGSNSLRYLYLAAPILYYDKTLLPCWTKVLLMTDDSLSRKKAPANFTFNSPTFGELTSYNSSLDWSDGQDIPLAKAALNFRRLLKVKAASKKDMGLSLQDILDLIHEEDLLSPWREWFPKMADSLGVKERLDDKNILIQVIQRLEETIDEDVDENDRKRFSEKSHYLLDARDADDIANL